MSAPAPQVANIDAEQQLLGALLAFGEPAWAGIGNSLAESDFYRDDHRRIYRYVKRFANAGAAFDALVISDSMMAANESELAGGLPYLLELVAASASSRDTKSHASIIKKYAGRREALALASELAAGASPNVIAEKLAQLESGGASPLEGARITMADAARAKILPVEFVVEPLQRGDVGILSGADGVGKSFAALALAASVAAGVSVGGIFQAGGKGKAIYIAGEDREADHIRRMKSIQALLNDEHQIRSPAMDFDLIPLAGQRLPILRQTKDGYEKTPFFSALSEKIKGYDIAIIDPLRMFHDLQENDGVGMDKLVRSLVEIAMRNQQVIVVIHHASQGAMLDGRDDHHAGRGATDFPAGCRAAWTLRGMSKKEAEDAGVDEESRRDWRVLVNGKASHSKEAGKTWLTRQGDGVLRRASYTPDDLVEAKKTRVGVNKQKERAINDENDF